MQEIFAVQVLQGMRFPEVLEWGDEKLSLSYVLPDEAMKDVALRSQPEPENTPHLGSPEE